MPIQLIQLGYATELYICISFKGYWCIVTGGGEEQNELYEVKATADNLVLNSQLATIDVSIFKPGMHYR